MCQVERLAFFRQRGRPVILARQAYSRGGGDVPSMSKQQLVVSWGVGVSGASLSRDSGSLSAVVGWGPLGRGTSTQVSIGLDVSGQD